jgi:glycosyltransferase involved in cell wall biosynthesis
MKVSFVATDFPGIIYPHVTGGVSSFIGHLTTLLQDRDDDISIVVASSEHWPIEEKWQSIYRSRGIKIIYAGEPDFSMPVYPNPWTLRVGEQVTKALHDADIVYFQDWGGFGFDATSRARFQTGSRPCYVSVLHGGSAWVQEGDRELPNVPDYLYRHYFERYMIQYSDFVASPSRYMLSWVKEKGYVLPPVDRVRALGLPLTGRPKRRERSDIAESPFKQLVFFGRLETRKGFEVFIRALLLLARTSRQTLMGLEKVVLLGHDSQNKIGSAEDAAQMIRDIGLPVSCLTNLDSKGAQQYLADHIGDSLVVIPSLQDNFPYTVVEVSQIDGLNMICSDVGGVSEILGKRGSDQLFQPRVHDLAEKMTEWLRRGRVASDRLGHYDADAGNQRWLTFHDEVSDYVRDAAHVRTSVQVPVSRNKKSLDICIPFFNHGRYLPQLLLSLDHQTSRDFNVIAIDDGSTEPDSKLVFDSMHEKFASNGWTFLRQDNAFVDAARNAAADQGSAEFICFLDADDVAALNLVERLLEAIHLSGDDCLMTCYHEFRGSDFPLDLKTGTPNSPCVFYKRPIGVDLVLSLSDPDVLGSPVMIVRRAAFEAVGGFTETKDAGHEDYELYIKLAFSGFKVDVLPEPLQFKRAHNRNLSSDIDRYIARMRVVHAYEHHLRAANLEGLASAFLSLACEAESLRDRVHSLEAYGHSTDDYASADDRASSNDSVFAVNHPSVPLPEILRPRDLLGLTFRQKVAAAEVAIRNPRSAWGFFMWHTKQAIARIQIWRSD